MKRSLLAAVLLLPGCASFNANFKANKYASEARQLDSEGRTIEAAGYWGRAAVKADSLLVRSPNGKYAANALAIRGEAFASVGQCGQASRILPTAIERLKDVAHKEQAIMALASCELQLGSPELAASTVRPVTESKDGGRRRQAMLLLGTAERQSGQNEAALASLDHLTGTPALIQRTLAYAGAHDVPAATSAFDSLVALRDSTLPWDSLLTITGRSDPLLASQLTTDLVSSRILSLDRSAGLAFADASRLATVDSAAQRRRYDDIITMAGPGPYASRARFDLARMRVSAADSMADLNATLEAMQEITATDEALQAVFIPLRRRIEMVQRLMDSAAPGQPQGDMRRFLAAEVARDTLDAPRLAANIFSSIPVGWPESPYAAKAWLAARQLTGDTLDAGGQFTSSPYLAVVRGEEGTTYTQLEDSLANFARSLVAAASPQGVKRGVKRPGTVNPADDGTEGDPAPEGEVKKPTRPGSRASTAPLE